MKVQDIVRLMKWGGWAVQLAATKFLGFWAVCVLVAVWCRLVMVVLWLTYHWHWSSILYKAGNSRTAAAIPGICWLVGAHFVGPICGDWARRTLWPETHSPPLDIPKRVVCHFQETSHSALCSRSIPSLSIGAWVA